MLRKVISFEARRFAGEIILIEVWIRTKQDRLMVEHDGQCRTLLISGI